MNILERNKYLEKLPFEKQLAFAVLSSERSYKEIEKIFPKFLNNKTRFRDILDELWKYLKGNSVLTKEDWRDYGLKIEEFFEKKTNYGNHEELLETSNALKLTMGMIVWQDETHLDSSSCGGKSCSVISSIYDNKNLDGLDGIKWYNKEIDWLTKALNLIAESEDIPSSYSWFLERVPDYERGKTTKDNKDID